MTNATKEMQSRVNTNTSWSDAKSILHAISEKYCPEWIDEGEAYRQMYYDLSLQAKQIIGYTEDEV